MKSFISISASICVFMVTLGCQQHIESISDSSPVISQWQIVDFGDSIDGINRINFVTPSTGFLIGAYRKEPYTPLILRTVSNGISWEVIDLKPPTVSGLYNFYALSTSALFATGQDLLTKTVSLFKSKDGGRTWIKIDGNFPTEGSHALWFLTEQRGIAQAYNGLLLTKNGGRDWELTFKDEPSFRNFDHIFFLNEQVGFAAGGIYSDDSNLGSPVFNLGSILRTRDGGNTWQRIKSDLARITSIFFLDTQVGYLTTQKQELWRTLDNGDSWELVTSAIPVVPMRIHFLSQQEGILVGIGKNGSGIYRTTDGGKIWISEYTTTKFELTDIAVIDSQTMYAVGSGGKLLKRKLP